LLWATLGTASAAAVMALLWTSRKAQHSRPAIFASLQAVLEVLKASPTPRLKGFEELLQGLSHSHKVTHVDRYPVVILEGLDGVGKSTLAKLLLAALERRWGAPASLIATPPQLWKEYRGHFDSQPERVRRAFYAASNYAACANIQEAAQNGPVVVDRFWPSTIAYAYAAAGVEPDKEIEMPQDLAQLLPLTPLVGILLSIESEAERAARIKERAKLQGPRVTEEEKHLEHDAGMRSRASRAYAKLRLRGQALIKVEALGSPEELCEQVTQVIETRAVPTPVSVNWHMTRECNYKCAFCFHTQLNSFFLPSRRNPGGMEKAQRVLRGLEALGMRKLNFSGGEPFLHPKELGELVMFCKRELHLESVSIVSNGSKITHQWFKRFGPFLDILAVSCDSFNEDTNVKHGRGQGNQIQTLRNIRDWCKEFSVKFKLNSVITSLNWSEDMSEKVQELQPDRWKIFQCLLIEGENMGEGAKRDAGGLAISLEKFNVFLELNGKIREVFDVMKPETNSTMMNSYLILDEHMRFLNCTTGMKVPGKSLLSSASVASGPAVEHDESMADTLAKAGWDLASFSARDGYYPENWSR